MDYLKRERFYSDLRVGLLSFSALFFAALGVTFAGGEKGLFLQKSEFMTAQMSDVGGLKKGSPVTMGGMPIGKVTNVRFGSDIELPIEVVMQVRSDVRTRIKINSVPMVRTQGMLGDRYVDISPGTFDSPTLGAQGTLIGSEATDFDKTLQNANAALQQTTKMITAVNDQRGTFGQLFYDEVLYKQLVEMSNQINELLADFKKNPKKYVKLEIF